MSPNQKIKIHILFLSMECYFPKLVVQFQSLIGTRINADSVYHYPIWTPFRANIDFHTHRFSNWITNFGKSHSIDGKRMWILIFWFGLNYWTNIDSQSYTWFSRVSNSSRTYHSWAQVNHSTNSHSFIGHDINHNDSVMIFQTGHVKEIIFMIGSFMILFILGIVIM